MLVYKGQKNWQTRSHLSFKVLLVPFPCLKAPFPHHSVFNSLHRNRQAKTHALTLSHPLLQILSVGDIVDSLLRFNQLSITSYLLCKEKDKHCKLDTCAMVLNHNHSHLVSEIPYAMTGEQHTCRISQMADASSVYGSYHKSGHWNSHSQFSIEWSFHVCE